MGVQGITGLFLFFPLFFPSLKERKFTSSLFTGVVGPQGSVGIPGVDGQNGQHGQMGSGGVPGIHGSQGQVKSPPSSPLIFLLLSPPFLLIFPLPSVRSSYFPFLFPFPHSSPLLPLSPLQSDAALYCP